MKDTTDAPPPPVNTQAAIDTFLAVTGSHVAAYLDACIHCGQCSQACHFHEVTKDPKYTPALKLQPITRVYKRHKAPLSGIKRMVGLVPPELTADYLIAQQELLFDSCTMCGRCTEVCPMGIDIASIVGLSRQAMVAAGLGPADLMEAAENSRDKGSPLGMTAKVLADRIDWLADDNEVEIPLDREKAEVLITVSSIEMMKYPDSIVAMAKLLNHAKVDWTISTKGYEATNFGVLSGKTDVARIMVERLVEAGEAVGAKTLVIPECGHAYGAMRWSGANMLGRPLPFAVAHITEFVAALVRDGKLKLKPMAGSLTYHDPCQVSRRGGGDPGGARHHRRVRDRLSRDGADRQPQLVLRRRRRGAGDGQRRALAPRGVPHQDRPGRGDRRREYGFGLRQLPADDGRKPRGPGLAARGPEPGRGAGRSSGRIGPAPGRQDDPDPGRGGNRSSRYDR